MFFGFRRTRVSPAAAAAPRAAGVAVAARAAAALLIPLAFSGCGTSAAGKAADPSGAGGHADAKDGGSQITGDVDSSAASKAPSSGPPGAYLTSESAAGSSAGPCAATPLGDVLTAIRAANPALADIRAIYDPTTATTDGSFIYAYDVGAYGYDIVFQRGLGDCTAGCTENDYQYFWTNNDSCQPVQVGHYHTAWGKGTCLTVDGTPMWSHPTAPDPLTVCGSDNSPRELRGTYSLNAAGQRTACASNAVAGPLARVVKLYIEQGPAALDAGFVTFSSTGDPLIDGVRLPARFQRWRFEAALPATSTTLSCPRAVSITAHYDFEGYEPGSLDALELGDDACGACKGSLSAALSASIPIQ